jgi:hypothetical protein
MRRKTVSCIILVSFLLMPAVCLARQLFVEETDTPIALHYGGILKDYIAFIAPMLDTGGAVIEASRGYFERLGYRVVRISIEKTTTPKLSVSWKKPHTKLAVAPRMVCSLSAGGTTVRLHDQGDDYVLLQNHGDGTSIHPGLFVTVGITHQWE